MPIFYNKLHIIFCTIVSICTDSLYACVRTKLMLPCSRMSWVIWITSWLGGDIRAYTDISTYSGDISSYSGDTCILLWCQHVTWWRKCIFLRYQHMFWWHHHILWWCQDDVTMCIVVTSAHILVTLPHIMVILALLCTGGHITKYSGDFRSYSDTISTETGDIILTYSHDTTECICNTTVLASICIHDVTFKIQQT